MSVEKWLNQCEYLKMVQFVRVLEKWYNPGEYREKIEPLRVSENCPYEYRKRVESARVPEKGFGLVTENGRIRVSIEKW